MPKISCLLRMMYILLKINALIQNILTAPDVPLLPISLINMLPAFRIFSSVSSLIPVISSASGIFGVTTSAKD
jgi:hypothetical protein